ncbi:MAG: DUF6452 family protein [Paludibacteraceae bacterium]
MNRKHNILLFLIGLLVLGLSACSNSDDTCRKSRSVSAGIYFYKDTLNINTGDTVSLALSVDSITVYGLDVDSILYKNVKKVSNIHVPLNPFADESKFVIKSNMIYDTLTIRYTQEYQFLSLECGSVHAQHLSSVSTTGHFFKKTTISTSEVNTTTTSSNATNIKIHHFVK